MSDLNSKKDAEVLEQFGKGFLNPSLLMTYLEQMRYFWNIQASI